MLYGLTEANPLERFWDLRRDFERLFNEALPFDAPDNGRALFAPALEVDEDADGLTLRVEVPGVAPDNLAVSVNGHVVTIEGERVPRKVEGASLHRSERRYGKFSRSLNLPEHFDANTIEARHEHGILTLRVPRSEAAKPRSIRIESR